MLALMNILLATAIVGVLGLVFGGILAYADKALAVPQDDRIDKIVEVLPGANCGGCGFAGCSNYAESVVSGESGVNGCPVGGDETARKIAEIMGVEAGSSVRMRAYVRCAGGDRAENKYDYKGAEDCLAASIVSDGPKSCSYGCFGLGSCVRACAFGAIEVKDGKAVVDKEKCTACKKCAEACPRGIITMIPYDADVRVACINCDKGAVVRKICEVGCIGCGICAKTCQYDAIHVENNVAVIDYDKCTRCGECAAKCPRKIIEVPAVSEEAAETAEA